MRDVLEPELVLSGSSTLETQIRDGIRDLILSGTLLAGEELPTVRQTAVALSVRPEIVERAYAELERAGYLTSADLSGTFVTSLANARPRGLTHGADLENLCSEFLNLAASHGYCRQAVFETLQVMINRSKP